MTFAEGRLIYQQQASSTEVEDVSSLLQDPKTNLEKLQEAFLEGRRKHLAKPNSPDFPLAIAENLKIKNGTPLQAIQKLDALGARVGTNNDLKDLKFAIQNIRQRIDPQAPIAPHDQIKTPPVEPEKPKTFATQIGDTAESISTSVLPKTWSDKLSRGQKIAAGTVMTLGAGVLLWQLGKMLWNRGKKSAGEGKEAAGGSKGGFWKKLLIGGGIGLAAFFGIRHLLGYGASDTNGPDGNKDPNNKQKKPSVAEKMWNQYAPQWAKDTAKVGGEVVTNVKGVGTGVAQPVIETGTLAIDHILYFIGQGRCKEGLNELDSKGWALLERDGRWFVQTMTGMFLLPIAATQNLQKYWEDEKSKEEYLMLWGTTGATYVIGQATLRAIVFGNAASVIPLTRKDIAWTVMKMSGGPITSIADALSAATLPMRQGGYRNALQGLGTRMKYTSISKLVRSVKAMPTFVMGGWHNADILGRDILKMSEWATDLETMKRLKSFRGANLLGSFSEREITNMDSWYKSRWSEIKNALTTVKPEGKYADLLADAKKAAQYGEMSQFREEMGHAIAAHMNKINPVDALVETVKVADAAGDTIKVADATTDTVRAADATIDIGKAAKVADVADATIDTATAGAKTAQAVETVTEGVKTFDELKRAIDTAKAAKDNRKLAELMKSPILKQAAQSGNPTARSLVRVQRLLTTAKWGGRALIVIGTLIDAALIVANETEISEAQKEGNLEKEQTLKSKRQSLAASGTAGLGLTGLGFTSLGWMALPAAPFVIGGSVYANGIYDSVIDWEKKSGEWMNEAPDELKKKLDSITYGKIDMGKRAAYGDTLAGYIWKRLPLVGNSNEQLSEEETDRLYKIEQINSSMRQEILAAYFLKTMKVTRLPEENDEQFQERMTTLVRDRMNYMRRMTDGTYITSNFGQRYFDQAGDYADLMAIRRSQQSSELRYLYGSEERALDLNSLDYIRNDNLKNSAAHMKFLKTLHLYDQEVKMQQDAVRDLYQTPEII